MLMKKMLLYLLCGAILISTAIIASPGAVFACSCVASPSVDKLVKDELDRKTAIFSGKVIKVTPPPQKETMSSADLVQVDFEVTTVWKGELKQQTVIYTAMDSASCGYEGFNVGGDYIVSAYEDSGKLETGMCELTKPVSAAGSELDVLGEGYAPIPLSAGEVLPSSKDAAYEVANEVPSGESKESEPSKTQIILGSLALFLMIGVVITLARRRR